MNMTVGQILGGLAGIVVLISAFIEITPIKVNPISAFLTWIGRKTSKDVMDQFGILESKVGALDDKFHELSNKVDKMSYLMDERNVIACRVRILQFGDECRRNRQHSKEMFDQVLEDIDVYEHYCAAHEEFKNNKTVLTTERIKEAYAKCLKDDTFL